MTLHNLGDHISWLLQSKQIPPAGPPYDSRETDTDDVEIIDGTSFNPVLVETEAPVPQAIPACPAPRTPNVDQEFVRPDIPSSVQEPRGVGNSASNVMAKLSSASKPARPTLLSQHQLATPTSTTGSLSAAWTASFHKDG
jgi:bloom syndrome protein